MAFHLFFFMHVAAVILKSADKTVRVTALLFSEVQRSVAHAAGSAQCSQCRRDDAGHYLQNRFPSLLILHNS